MGTSDSELTIGEATPRTDVPASMSGVDLPAVGGVYTDPDFRAAALVTIDVQRDVLDDGPFEIPGTSAALPSMSALVHGFRDAGRPIVHIVRLYKPDGANADLCRRYALSHGMRALTPDDPGSQLPIELLPDPNTLLDAQMLLAGGVQPLSTSEVAIYKPRWGAFYETPLEDYLCEQKITTLVFCGCNFPNCPRTSIYQASERDFKVVLAPDAISGLYDRGAHELAAIGVHLVSAPDVLSALASK